MDWLADGLFFNTQKCIIEGESFQNTLLGLKKSLCKFVHQRKRLLDKFIFPLAYRCKTLNIISFAKLKSIYVLEYSISNNLSDNK